jgi:Trk K+ transport system NAD-binding subunit
MIARDGGPPARQRLGFWRLLRANLYDLGLLVRQSWFTLSLFGVVLVAGSWYEYIHVRRSVPEAVYDTLQLLIFQQSSQPFPGDPLGETLFFLLPILGLLVVVQSVLNFGRRVLDKASRQEAWQVSLATTFRQHVIVSGLGRIGLRVITRLIEAGYQVVAVERDFKSQFVPRVLSMGVPVITGDARTILTLRQAGLGRARAVIADINGDQANIEIALAARTERPEVRVVLRAFNEDLDRNLNKIFGPDSAFSHSALAAPTIAAASVSREISFAIPVDGQLLGVATLDIRRGSRLTGSIRECEATCGVRVLDQRSRGRSVRWSSKATFHPGDRITLLGPLSALEEVRLQNAVAGEPLPLQHPTPEFNRVIVCGLGKVGYRVVERLSRLNPRPEIVAVYLDDDQSSFLERVEGLPGVTTVQGDARDEETLRRAGLDRAYAVAAVTSDDLTNLQTALAARSLRPDVHVVVRVFSDALAEELNSAFEIHTTYSTSNLASPTLAAAAVLTGLKDGGVDRAFTVGRKIFSSDDFTAEPGGLLAGHTVEEIRTRHQLLVLALERDGTPRLLPPPETRIGAGDRGVLVAPLEALEKLARTRRPAS